MSKKPIKQEPEELTDHEKIIRGKGNPLFGFDDDPVDALHKVADIINFINTIPGYGAGTNLHIHLDDKSISGFNYCCTILEDTLLQIISHLEQKGTIYYKGGSNEE